MVKEQSDVWECACGNKLHISLEKILSEKPVCPKCGAPVGWERGEPHPPDMSDTQAVDLRDMAHMAQEGIGVATSGEWDTREKS